MPETPVVPVLVPRHHDAQRPVDALAVHRIRQLAAAHGERHRKRLVGPHPVFPGPAVQQSLVEERQVRRGRDGAAAGHADGADLRTVEAEDGVFRDLRDRRLRQAEARVVFARQRFARVHAFRHPAVLVVRQSDEEIGQPQRQGDAFADELAELARAPTLHDLRDHPHAGGRVVLEARPGRPGEAPLPIPLEAPGRVFPVERPERGVGEPAGMQKELLHGDDVFPVRSELRDDVRHALAEVQVPVLDQQPPGRRGDRLGRREHAVERVVVRAPKGLEEAQAPFPRHGDLCRREQSLVDFLPDPLPERIDAFGLQPDGAWIHHGLAVRHLCPPGAFPAANLSGKRLR